MDPLQYKDQQGKVVQVFECCECYSLLPYPQCPHHCPEGEDDEGFEEDMEAWVNELSQMTCMDK